MKFGIDRLVTEPALRAPLNGRRMALLAHPASVTEDLKHSLDALAACCDLKITAAFGPQHGLRGEKQDNMIESPDLQRSGAWHPGIQPVRRSAQADRCDDGHIRCHPRRSAGFGLPHLYVHNDAALCSGSGVETSQSGVGAGSAQSCWPAGRRLDAANRMAKLCWRWPVADASRAHAR